MLFSCPSSLALIASHARQKHLEMIRLGMRVALVTSEKLYDQQRAVISEVFGCPVANGHGARDAGFLAPEDIIVETAGPDGKPTSRGEPGEILVTRLATADFPFVHCRTGDIGVLGKQICFCGRGLPVLEDIQGHSTNFVVVQHGNLMHGLALIYTVRDLPGVERFRIEQAVLSRPDHRQGRGQPAFRPSVGESHRARCQGSPGSNGGYSGREKVGVIASETSGKFRYVVSHVRPSVGTKEAANA
ncbi:hypothetical protein ACCUM_2628 [Candidatus Accumulibacter phosphatis]|uniref:Phenylacetate-coenzyme A ligase n=2 Tax=Candidatus Accumulibacter phosphatis TaxID=327160 RepID=A0A5S4EHU2_9PROT|nr:hypothetical protein ACCUM_2628 [Candidatus Accumulibacter phosphatis]